jgi:hypothetical protein
MDARRRSLAVEIGKGTTTGLVAVTQAKCTATAVLRLKTGFALTHLQVAANSARQAYKIEQANANAPFGSWFDGMMQLVPVSVVMAGAALEASANEVLQDILDSQPDSRLTPSRKKLLVDLKKDHSGNAVDKFRRLALLMERNPNTSTEIWHNARLLVKFRNEFMHFRPSWDDDDIHSGDLVEKLRKKIPVVDAYRGNFLFPYGLMSYGCAKWAVQTVLEFSTDFAKLLGVTNKFGAVTFDFALP